VEERFEQLGRHRWAARPPGIARREHEAHWDRAQPARPVLFTETIPGARNLDAAPPMLLLNPRGEPGRVSWTFSAPGRVFRGESTAGANGCWIC
jgi:hypothetical protein